MDLKFEAQLTLTRLLPHLNNKFSAYATHSSAEWAVFLDRVNQYFPALFETLFPLYGNRYDAFYYFEELLYAIADSYIKRPQELKDLDKQRLIHPDWFQSNNMVGAVCYVDLFAENLVGLQQKIPYLKELGITYLHLMPFFLSPDGENDGGYAISSYRDVNHRLGTTDQLINLASELRHNGISLIVDFVFNHTSGEHEWALKAKQGNQYYQNYYWIFPDRIEPDKYEKTLREIFPDEHPGTFTYNEAIDKWVWTTFHSYQWDLNYQNPAVFLSMAQEMLYLCNMGVDGLRLDAVAFIWKKLGTNCENMPEAHLLIQAFNLVSRIAAPSLIYKSEAIVHPDEVIKYIAPEECQLSYNPLLMALIWESLATREVKLLRYSMQKRFRIPDGCSWVNYVRCHDDIGWTFSDDDANELWINGFDHRKFLNGFYIGKFPGSFAKGLPFQENPQTGDCRISGTCASLAGLEKALAQETNKEVDLAIKRILLIHGIIMTIGGIPLIYLGDEYGTMNDYSYLENKAKLSDSRWVHRPNLVNNHTPTKLSKVSEKIFSGLKELITIRKESPVFSDSHTEFLGIKNDHVLGFIRQSSSNRLLVLANFSEKPQRISISGLIKTMDMNFFEIRTKVEMKGSRIDLEPYAFLLLKMKPL